MPQHSDESLAKWECIINDVEKTDFPLECIKKIIIRLTNKRRRTLNFELMKQQGMDIEKIHNLLHATLTAHGEEIQDIDWIIDVRAVAELVQPETDRILKAIK